MGTVVVAALAGRVDPRTSRDYDIYVEVHQLDGKRRDAIAVALTRSVLNNNVFPLHIPELA